jgi:hypothetical protein
MRVFDPQKALQPLNGKQFAYPSLREELKKIRFEHIEELSPEFDINELLHLALRSHWLEETGDGQYIVHVG